MLLIFPLARIYINRGASWENYDPEINKRHCSQHKTTWPCITSRREMFSLMCEIEIYIEQIMCHFCYENNIIYNNISNNVNMVMIMLTLYE